MRIWNYVQASFILYLYEYVMVLTREEKEKLVLELYNRRTSIRENSERRPECHLGIWEK